MNVLVTGANGFIAKNLILELKKNKSINIYEYSKSMPKTLLDTFVKEADFIFHFAGVNRSENDTDFIEGNLEFTKVLIGFLKKHHNKSPILFTSSVQAGNNTLYGQSKLAAENLLNEFSLVEGNRIFLYRLTNIFGKYSKPNFNSVVSTFCFNISRGLPIKVDDPSRILTLIYIDDLVANFLNLLQHKEETSPKYNNIEPTYQISLEKLVNIIYSFKNINQSLLIPDVSNTFVKKLHSTYLTFLPEENLAYNLVMNNDHRGSFTEFFRTTNSGQVSINILKPKIVKGNHWHNTKNEKFIIVSGHGVIRLRKLNTPKIYEYYSESNNLFVVDIPPGYVHNIENLGESDMVVIIWVNEIYDKQMPDTFYLEL
jgi:UDP-2-acetamido-2,6-beta-L-arabino-hexul-4-ose reductase